MYDDKVFLKKFKLLYAFYKSNLTFYKDNINNSKLLFYGIENHNYFMFTDSKHFVVLFLSWQIILCLICEHES